MKIKIPVILNFIMKQEFFDIYKVEKEFLFFMNISLHKNIIL